MSPHGNAADSKENKKMSDSGIMGLLIIKFVLIIGQDFHIDVILIFDFEPQKEDYHPIFNSSLY
jgi:hypothetical protein